ncbi:MAG: hypothetical protein WCY19_05085 [Candidatus Gastranaerophilaceae bacterium]
MRINNENGLKGLDDFNLRAADPVCSDCEPSKCDDKDCDVYLDFWGVQVQEVHGECVKNTEDGKIYSVEPYSIVNFDNCIPMQKWVEGINKKITVAEWADKYKKLTPHYSVEIIEKISVLEKVLKQAKGKAKRKIRRQLKSLRGSNCGKKI